MCELSDKIVLREEENGQLNKIYPHKKKRITLELSLKITIIHLKIESEFF